MNRIVFITGLPLTGKSTISGVLKGFHNFKHLSTGDVARGVQKLFKYRSSGDNTDKFAEEIIRFEVNRFIKDNNGNSIIIDGFPRNESQLRFVDKNIMKQKKYKIVLLTMSTDLILGRAKNRKRSDDDLLVVEKRIKSFPIDNITSYMLLNGIEHKLFDMGKQTALEDVKRYILGE